MAKLPRGITHTVNTFYNIITKRFMENETETTKGDPVYKLISMMLLCIKQRGGALSDCSRPETSLKAFYGAYGSITYKNAMDTRSFHTQIRPGKLLIS